MRVSSQHGALALAERRRARRSRDKGSFEDFKADFRAPNHLRAFDSR